MSPLNSRYKTSLRTILLTWLIGLAIFPIHQSVVVASELELINNAGAKSSVTLTGFNQESRKLQIEKNGKSFDYTLSDLQFSSKLDVLRSSEMQAVLSEKAQVKKHAILLYGFITLLVIILALVIGFSTFQGSAFLITGQEGRARHFKAWMKILALFALIAAIRFALLGGVSWIDLLNEGWQVLRPEDGLAVIFAILGSVVLIKMHYRETLQLAAITAAVHIVFFSLVVAGIVWLIWKWNGGDWGYLGDELLIRLILRPFKLI